MKFFIASVACALLRLTPVPHAHVGDFSVGEEGKGWDWTTAYDEDKYAACLVDRKCSGKMQPVCGADGKTHNNECSAVCAKVSIVSTGECGACMLKCCGNHEAASKSLDWSKQVAGGAKVHFEKHEVCIPAHGKKCPNNMICK